MGKHEIRLRRQRLTARGSERFRNYGAVLKQHEEEKRIKVIVKIFTYFLIIAALILLIVLLSRWDEPVASLPDAGTTFILFRRS
jgi:hypothetical protein